MKRLPVAAGDAPLGVGALRRLPAMPVARDVGRRVQNGAKNARGSGSRATR